MTDLEAVVANFEKYAPLESLTELESRVKPLLSSAQKLLDEYRLDNSQMKSCVLQFDETLSLKADRWNIQQVQKNLEDNYMTVELFTREKSNI
jgi:hypothetical protein